jgi:hypothetical protein
MLILRIKEETKEIVKMVTHSPSRNANRQLHKGFDNSQDQECANLICTYAENNATCTQEGVRSAAAAPIKLTCEECFRKFLTPEQLQSFLFNVFPGVGLPLEQVCAEKALTERDVRTFLLGIVDLTTTNNLIACLKQAGFLP